MNRKRTAVLLLSMVMLISLTGCRSEDYKKAVAMTETGDWQSAKEIFTALGDYRDSAEKLLECEYRIAMEKMDAGDYDTAVEILTSLGDYADASVQADECRYRKATLMLESGKWDDAEEIFRGLGEYKDSSDMVPECSYRKAASMLEAGKWDEAAVLFEGLGEYKDSSDMVLECSYRKAAELMSGESYDQAAEIFKKFRDYRDSGELYSECLYQKALGLYENGEFEAAYPVFLGLGNYMDSGYYSVLSILQYDQQSFVDIFVRNMSRMLKEGNVSLSMKESVASYERDSRFFDLDRGPGDREVSIAFEPSYSDGSVTSRGQISTIHVIGDTRTAGDIQTTLSETMIASVLAMAVLDDNASPEEFTLILGDAYAEMLAKFPIKIPEAGHFERVEIPYEHFECVAAVSAWPNYYRFLFMITMPELVKAK